MNHIKWDEIAKGFDNPTMHRLIKVIGWLSKGYSIPCGQRILAMVTSTAGLPYLVLRAETIKEGEPTTYIALGMDPDLGLLYTFVKEITDEDWDALLVNVAANEQKRRHPR